MIEIDVEKILHNVRAVREMIGPSVKLCAVLKGDGKLLVAVGQRARLVIIVLHHAENRNI